MTRAHGCQITGYPNETDGIPNHGRGLEAEGVGGKEAVGLSSGANGMGSMPKPERCRALIHLWRFCVKRQLWVTSRNRH
jgi:hypothetical protein